VFGLKGMLSFALVRYTKRQKLTRTYLRGVQHPIWLRSSTTDVYTMREVFVNTDYDIALPFVPEVIVDAGANIGLTAIFFTIKYPKAIVYALEPESSNYRVLQRNTRPYPNIIPIQSALWRTSNPIFVTDIGKGKHGFIVSDVMQNELQTAETVPAITIDDLMSRYGIECIDLLKIDIEGSEKEVFESSGRWIHKVNAIIAELHEHLRRGCWASFSDATKGMISMQETQKLAVRVRPVMG